MEQASPLQEKQNIIEFIRGSIREIVPRGWSFVIVKPFWDNKYRVNFLRRTPKGNLTITHSVFVKVIESNGSWILQDLTTGPEKGCVCGV